jgi:hypothetical protein
MIAEEHNCNLCFDKSMEFVRKMTVDEPSNKLFCYIEDKNGEKTIECPCDSLISNLNTVGHCPGFIFIRI